MKIDFSKTNNKLIPAIIQDDETKSVLMLGYMNKDSIDKTKKTILVLGGSLGAKSINEGVLNNISLIRESSYQVIWQTGKFYYKNILKNAKLLFDGKDRISTKDNIYFNYLEPYNSSLACPKNGIYSYSFSLDNYKFQPSGSCNMSRIKKVTLEVETNETEKKFNLNENLQYQYLLNRFLPYSNPQLY